MTRGRRGEGEELVSNGALPASQLGRWRQDWEVAVLQVLEGEGEGLLRDQEEEVVVVDLTYIQVEEVEVAVHLCLEEVEVVWMAPAEVEGAVGAGCSEEEVEETKEGIPYLEEEEVEVELNHQEEEEVEEGLPHNQNVNPPLDLSLLRPSRKVLPAQKSQIQQCGVLA